MPHWFSSFHVGPLPPQQGNETCVGDIGLCCAWIPLFVLLLGKNPTAHTQNTWICLLYPYTAFCSFSSLNTAVYPFMTGQRLYEWPQQLLGVRLQENKWFSESPVLLNCSLTRFTPCAPRRFVLALHHRSQFIQRLRLNFPLPLICSLLPHVGLKSLLIHAYAAFLQPTLWPAAAYVCVCVH